MTTSVDQALLYFVDLRLQVRGNPAARAIVDRCLNLLTAAKSADPLTIRQLEAEVNMLREELKHRFGEPKRLAVH